ncbi:hypothetical protein [Leptolyngbya ohadii]|uniref:hypothetical protein n=1 Tax=Leptolyngbya ohadii TaxID=1962290 RepID=UPI000B59CF13|nr:hypothetical protein [Leptolyngbya ohadii]
MRMQRVLSFLQVIPIAVSLTGITAFSGYAAEVPSQIKSHQSTVDDDRLGNVTFETADEAIASEQTLQSSSIDSLIEDGAIEDHPNTPVVPNVVSNAVPSPSELASGLASELEQPTSTLAENLSAENSNQSQFIQADTSAFTEDPAPTSFSIEPQVVFSPIALSELAQSRSEPESEHWQIAQAEPIPEPEAPQPPPEAAEPSASPRWRFSVTPNVFVPFSVNGRVTVRNFRSDLNLGLSDVLEPLNFALAGRVEAWRGSLGLIFDAAYFDLGQERSSDLSIPNCLCNILPSRIDTEINVQYGQFDLGVGYRYGTDVSSAATEFEMGELVFDAILGIRIYAFEQEINISTNLGGDRNLQSSTTLITPLASGRIRWNVSPTLAGWVRGDVAGFGIGGTLFATSFTAGIDWLFAGDTSLLLAYRLSTLQYTADVRGEELGANLLLHGPYLGMVFRF